jgi:autotransporter-associated beta strand protein
MNRAFALVWNVALGAWVVTHELARKRRKRGSARRGVLRLTVLLTAGAAPALAWGACTPALPAAGDLVTCTGLPITSNSFSSAANNLTVNVAAGTQMTAGQLGGTALSLSGTNGTLNNAGTIDPSALGLLTAPSTGVQLGNASSTLVAVNNLVFGSIYGTGGLLGATLSSFDGMALDLRSSSGGTVTIDNQGTISSRSLLNMSTLTSDAPVIAVTGGGTVNAINTGTINGRVGFERSGSGNTFVNAGTINGSVSLGDLGSNSFTAVTGSTVNAAAGLGQRLTGPGGTMNFAPTGYVDGGAAGINTLLLQNAATWTGSGTSGNGALNTDQYLNFTSLRVNSGTWALSGSNPFVATTLNGGTLQFTNPWLLGNTVTADGGMLEAGANGLTLASGIVLGAGNLTIGGSSNLTLAGTFTGVGGVIKQGVGTLTLSGVNNAFGGVTVNAGTVAVTAPNALGSGTLSLASGALLAYVPLNLANAVVLSGNASLGGPEDVHLNGALSGPGQLTKTGTGALYLNGPSTFAGGINVQAGTVLGDAASLRGAIAVGTSSTVVFDQAGTGTYAGTLSGSGRVLKDGSGALIFNGNSGTFAGVTEVVDGRLVIGGAAADAAAQLGGGVQVAAGAALAGHGTLLGNVVITQGATLSPGNSIGTLHVAGDLQLDQGAVLDFEFGSPASGNPFGAVGQGDSVVVGGALSLNGAVLDISDDGGFGAGLYRLFSYGGALTLSNGGITFGQVPAGNSYALQYLSGAGQINLLATGNSTLQFWNANGQASPTAAGGGSGVWSTSAPSWTDATGAITSAMTPMPGTAIFAGAPGVVTVDNTGGAVTAYGLQFASDGYRLNGDALTLLADPQGAAPVIRVGDGSAAGAAYTTTIDAVLSGTAGLDKTDLGTLVLNGVNTWTGDTRISGGTLSVAAEASLGALSSTLVLDGGVLQVTGNAIGTLARGIQLGSVGGGFDVAEAAHTLVVGQSLSGSGALLKAGAGTLELQGNNSYQGGTTVQQGTLLGNSGSLSGAITNHARVVFDQAADGVYAGAMSGSGTLTKQGQGTLTLQGANSYTGGTLVAEGALQGSTASLQGNIVNNAAVLVEQDIDGSLAANISGSGSLTKRGTGSVLLTGANTYSGGTVIEAGTLQGSAAAFQGDIQNNARLVIDQAGDGLLSAALSGSGSLVKTGAGALVVRQGQTFSGRTDVQQGTLVVGDAGFGGAAINGAVIIREGALLKGIGRVGVLDLYGTLAPGNSIGTLHVSGNATFQASARYQVEVNADGGHDLLAVDGRTTILGGSVLGLADGASWNPLTRYTILTSQGGISGQFNAVSSNLAFLTPTLDYASNAVTLSLARNEASFPSVGQTDNQRSTAAALESVGSGPLYARVLTLDGDSARQAFEAYAGEVRASAQVSLFDDAARVRRTLADRLVSGQPADAAAEGSGVHAWASAWGHRGHTDDNGNTARSRQQGTGWMAGSDLTLDNQVVLGVAVGQARSTLEVGARRSDAKTNSTYAGLYAGGTFGQWVVRSGLSAGRSDSRFTRSTGTVGGNQTLKSHDDADLWQGFVEVAHGSDIGRLRLEPYLNYARAELDQDAFAEQGGDAALAGEAQTRALDIGTAGLRTHWHLDSRFNTALVLNVGYQRVWGDTDAGLTQRFAAGGDAFDISGMPLARNAGVAEFGFRTQLTPAVELKADYQGRFGSGVQDQGAQITVRAAF